MSKQGETHVDLSPEQWAHVQAALEGQIQSSVAYAADLEAENARLQTLFGKVRKERDKAAAKMKRRRNVANWAAIAGELSVVLDDILSKEKE